MKANAFLLCNQDEILQAERLNMKIPNKEYKQKTFHFKLSALSHAYVTDDKKQIIAAIYGEPFIFEYNDNLWHAITVELDSK